MVAGEQMIKLLIVDDDEDDFFITSEYIKNIKPNKFQIEWCYKYEDALTYISNHAFNIYLIDYHLGAKTGLDLIKEAVINNWEQPFILLTGKGNQQIDIEAMQAGAMDYLIKSELDTEKLERCLRYSLERDKSIKALKANERKFRNIFERSADAVFLANKSLVFADINDATSRLFEYSKTALLSMNLLQMISGEQQISELKNQLRSNQEVENKELVMRTKSGAIKHCLLSLSKEENIDGGYYQGIIHDITSLKKAEKANLRIEKRGVADRLVHVLAHEVRNPLNNINLSLEQLRPEIQNGDSQIYFDILSRNSKRIEDLINELLSTSRPAQLVEQKLPLQNIIDQSISAAFDRITLKKIKLEIKYPEGEIMVLGDEEKLKIALLNIIINAVEAMDKEDSQLLVQLTLLNNQPQIIIQDNGCGITEENLSRLFEPYFTAKRNGMGLGLATTLNILQSHKADVEVLSKPGLGTTFQITFKNSPLKEKELAENN